MLALIRISKELLSAKRRRSAWVYAMPVNIWRPKGNRDPPEGAIQVVRFGAGDQLYGEGAEIYNNGLLY